MLRRLSAPALALLMTAALGCATQNRIVQGLGAAAAGVGTGVGCVLLGGNEAACAAAGVAAGAIVWAGLEYKRRSETRSELPPMASVPDVSAPGLSTPGAAPPSAPPRAMIIIDRFDVAPKQVSPGDTFSATTQYRLLLPSRTETRPVTQTFTLAKEGTVLQEIPMMVGELKDHGSYEIVSDFTLPDDAELGAYGLEQVLEAQTQSPEVTQATFMVVEKVAALATAGR